MDTRVEATGVRGVERLVWRVANPNSIERLMAALNPQAVGPDGKPVESASAGK